MTPDSNSLSGQLVAQAEHLLRLDRWRPKQANVRRAVSATYNGLFHFLGDEAGRAFVGGGAAKRPLRAALARALEHGSVRAACERMASAGAPGSLPASLRVCWRGPLSPDLRTFTRAFADLQDARHRADYDRNTTVRRADVERSLFLAREAMACWSRLDSDEAQAFLLAALAWKNLAAR